MATPDIVSVRVIVIDLQPVLLQVKPHVPKRTLQLSSIEPWLLLIPFPSNPTEGQTKMFFGHRAHTTGWL
jgi:hypothetical protein